MRLLPLPTQPDAPTGLSGGLVAGVADWLGRDRKRASLYGTTAHEDRGRLVERGQCTSDAGVAHLPV